MRKQAYKGIVAKAKAGCRYRYGRRAEPIEDWDEADETLRPFMADWCELWRNCGLPALLPRRPLPSGGSAMLRPRSRVDERILFNSQAFVDLYDAAVEVVDEIDDDEEE